MGLSDHLADVIYSMKTNDTLFEQPDQAGVRTGLQIQQKPAVLRIGGAESDVSPADALLCDQDWPVFADDEAGQGNRI